MAAVIANALKVGNIVNYKNGLYRVVSTQHVKPGKGGAFIQAELKGLTSGTKLNERLRSEETIDRVNLETKECQFLYKDGTNLELMDMDNYEQFSVDIEIAGEQVAFLKENMKIIIECIDTQIVSISLPDSVTLEITETEDYIKGQTAAPSYKPAVLENGITISVPPFVNIGDRVVVRTSDSTYIERAK